MYGLDLAMRDSAPPFSSLSTVQYSLHSNSAEQKYDLMLHCKQANNLYSATEPTFRAILKHESCQLLDRFFSWKVLNHHIHSAIADEEGNSNNNNSTAKASAIKAQDLISQIMDTISKLVHLNESPDNIRASASSPSSSSGNSSPFDQVVALETNLFSPTNGLIVALLKLQLLSNSEHASVVSILDLLHTYCSKQSSGGNQSSSSSNNNNDDQSNSNLVLFSFLKKLVEYSNNHVASSLAIESPNPLVTHNSSQDEEPANNNSSSSSSIASVVKGLFGSLFSTNSKKTGTTITATTATATKPQQNQHNSNNSNNDISINNNNNNNSNPFALSFNEIMTLNRNLSSRNSSSIFTPPQYSKISFKFNNRIIDICNELSSYDTASDVEIHVFNLYNFLKFKQVSQQLVVVDQVNDEQHSDSNDKKKKKKKTIQSGSYGIGIAQFVDDTNDYIGTIYSRNAFRIPYSSKRAPRVLLCTGVKQLVHELQANPVRIYEQLVKTFANDNRFKSSSNDGNELLFTMEMCQYRPMELVNLLIAVLSTEHGVYENKRQAYGKYKQEKLQGPKVNEEQCTANKWQYKQYKSSQYTLDEEPFPTFTYIVELKDKTISSLLVNKILTDVDRYQKSQQRFINEHALVLYDELDLAEAANRQELGAMQQVNDSRCLPSSWKYFMNYPTSIFQNTSVQVQQQEYSNNQSSTASGITVLAHIEWKVPQEQQSDCSIVTFAS